MKLDEALRAIRAKCLNCCGRSKKLVDACAVDQCPLWPYRKYQDGLSDRDTGGRIEQVSIWSGEGRR